MPKYPAARYMQVQRGQQGTPPPEDNPYTWGAGYRTVNEWGRRGPTPQQAARESVANAPEPPVTRPPIIGQGTSEWPRRSQMRQQAEGQGPGMLERMPRMTHDISAQPMDEYGMIGSLPYRPTNVAALGPGGTNSNEYQRFIQQRRRMSNTY